MAVRSVIAKYTDKIKSNLIECDGAGTPAESGLYLKQIVNPAIYVVSSVTSTLVTDHYVRTDPDIYTAVILEKAALPNIDSDQLYISLPLWLLYDAPQAEPCYTEINIYSDLNEPLSDLGGATYDLGIGAGTTRTYALKSTTERVE